MNFNPKITIITVVYNGRLHIERTIQSIQSQTYTNLEYLIMDGASKDGTLEIAKKYAAVNTLIFSDKDNGIYDAMNKGLKQATGDYILFINAGDELYEKETLAKIIAAGENADVYYGNTVVVNENRVVLGERRLLPPKVLTWKSLKYGMNVSHQSFVAKRTLCEPYRLNYKISADIDWVIRVLKKSEKIINTEIIISKFLEGGASNVHRKKSLLERFSIMSEHYGFFQTTFNHLYILVRYPVHRLFRKSMT
jgi:glycosyltransferase involved in cell wall biosynthesis